MCAQPAFSIHDNNIHSTELILFLAALCTAGTTYNPPENTRLNATTIPAIFARASNVTWYLNEKSRFYSTVVSVFPSVM